jgi:hypothetical protein
VQQHSGRDPPVGTRWLVGQGVLDEIRAQEFLKGSRLK